MRHPKRKIISSLLVILLLLNIVDSLPAAAAGETGTLQDSTYSARNTAYTIYVDPKGDDSTGDGTSAKPFKSLERARDKVRELPKNKGDIVVEFADGFYPVSETVLFDERDSGNSECTIYYQAAQGAKPLLSGGYQLSGTWMDAESDITWAHTGKAYKIPLARDEKLRAIYVNDKRAIMTRKTGIQASTTGIANISITKGQAPWAWRSGSHLSGNIIPASAGLSPDTRNPQNIELETGSTWIKQIVCAKELESSSTNTKVTFQMPYGAIAQNLGWGTEYKPGGNQDITNVFEWLRSPGEFYFDQAGQMLYYISEEGVDMQAAEVIIPELETILEVRGSVPRSKYAEYITFSGLSFAHTDWNLQEIEGSYGNATIQAATVLKAYADINQHNDIYRSYDIPPAAILVNTAKHIRLLDGEVKLTGYLGAHFENDVSDCEITGNYFGQTGGAGIVIGHLHHVYENDTSVHQVSTNNAGPDKEKFQNETEAVPRNIFITNNYLLENCYFFPGNAPITSFYTYNMQVLNNFIYKCSYSGMSIGWGWCNFDGAPAAAGDIQLPGQPTTTSRNNRVSYNRVEEICALLHDAGGIYTLGAQGDSWDDGSHTEMNYNYINAKRNPNPNDTGWVNGFHPDEGSTYIKFIGNVITNIVRSVYELNTWRRKSDMQVINGYSNMANRYNDAPNCTVEQMVEPNSIWPKEGHDIVLNSGLKNEYKHLIGEDVIPATDFELASNVTVEPGTVLNRSGALSAQDEVWLAPIGTVSYTESKGMTKAAGNEKTILVPSIEGEYKLYIKYADGTISDPSTHTLYAGTPNLTANVRDGEAYSISNINPLELRLGTNHTFTLNGNPITQGHMISEEGSWTLVATKKTGTPTGIENETYSFTTFISNANKLLTENKVVIPGALIQLEQNLGDTSKTIWLNESGKSALDPEDELVSYTAGNTDKINAPGIEREYRLTVTNADGSIDSQSDASVLVTIGEPVRLEITAKPNKLSYLTGERFDAAGLTVILHGSMPDGKRVLESSEYTISSFDSNKAGTQTITVNYLDLSAEFQVTVSTKEDPPKPPIVTVPVVSNVKAKPASYNSIKLSWSKVNGVDGYEIMRAESKTGTYQSIGSAKGSAAIQYTDTKVKLNTQYYYKVHAYKVENGFRIRSIDSQIVFAKTVLKVPSSVKAKPSGRRKVKVTWKKVPGANGYIIYTCTKRSGKYKENKVVKGASKKKGTTKKLKKGKTYYIKVAAYRTVNGKKIKSKYSAPKRVKVK